MRAGIDLNAGRASSTRLENGFGIGLAEQRLSQLQSEGAFSHARKPGEQKTARQSSPRDGPSKLLDDFAMSEDSVPGVFSQSGVHVR
jgi:hypothetical protein